MSTIGGPTANPMALSEEIYRMIRETSEDLAQQSRADSRAAVEKELEHGLDEARHIRKQAKAALRGAVVSGSISSVRIPPMVTSA